MIAIGSIVKGVKAGTFRVIGHHEFGNRVKEVDPTNYDREGRGSIVLPDDALVIVQAAEVEVVQRHSTGLVVFG